MKTWQRLCKRWTQLVFRERFADITSKIRVLRLLEEAMELAQAEQVTEAEALIIVTQVYSRPVGVPRQELGGVVITLASYAEHAGYDLNEAFYDEFERIMDPAIMEKVRRRNLDGDKIGFAKVPIRIGTFCSICLEPQIDSPAGTSCLNGHAGAKGLPSPLIHG